MPNRRTYLYPLVGAGFSLGLWTLIAAIAWGGSGDWERSLWCALTCGAASGLAFYALEASDAR